MKTEHYSALHDKDMLIKNNRNRPVDSLQKFQEQLGYALDAKMRQAKKKSDRAVNKTEIERERLEIKKEVSEIKALLVKNT